MTQGKLGIIKFVIIEPYPAKYCFPTIHEIWAHSSTTTRFAGSM